VLPVRLEFRGGPLLALVLLLPQEDWRAALERGDFAGAWGAVQALKGGVERARAEASLLYGAGDPSGAWRAAQAGLAQAPENLELHFYSAGAAIWLGEAGRAQEASAALGAALGRAELAPEERADWERTAGSLAGEASALAQGERARARALEIARAGALTGLAVAAGLLLWLVRSLTVRAR